MSFARPVGVIIAEETIMIQLLDSMTYELNKSYAVAKDVGLSTVDIESKLADCFACLDRMFRKTRVRRPRPAAYRTAR